jgi:hypothetical protein
MGIVWNVTPNNLTGEHERFGDVCYLHVFFFYMRQEY